MMPLHGGPLPLGDAAKELRAEIRVELDRVLARGREDAVARRQAAIQVAGLQADGAPLDPR